MFFFVLFALVLPVSRLSYLCCSLSRLSHFSFFVSVLLSIFILFLKLLFSCFTLDRAFVISKPLYRVILTTISEYGPLVTVVVTSVRKVVSLWLSFLIFPKPFTWLYVLFATMIELGDFDHYSIQFRLQIADM